MNRKIVALLLAVMLVASSVAALAVSTQYIITGNGVKIVYADGTETTVDLTVVHKASEQEAIDELTEKGYTNISLLCHWGAEKNQFLVEADKDGKTWYILVQISAEHEKGNVGQDTSGLPTSDTDVFTHYYTNYNDIDLIQNVTFAPKAFGNGMVFDHSSAKKLFTINLKWDSKAYITIKDDEGRLYPVANASWSAANNAYVMDLKAGEHTISWFGTDGAGYHANATKNNKHTMELRVAMKVVSNAQFITGGAERTDNVEIRFDYTVAHGEAHHVAADAAASAPKTGDAGMAYMTLAALIVMMGAAVVVTRKVRNF